MLGTVLCTLYAPTYGMIALINSILQMRILRYQEVKHLLAQSHMASKWQSWDLNPRSGSRACMPNHHALLCLLKIRIHIRPLRSNILSLGMNIAFVHNFSQ